MKTREKRTPERIIHDAIVAQGYIPDRGLRDTVDMLNANTDKISPEIRALAKKLPNPFLRKYGALSKKTLRELDILRGKAASMTKTASPKPPTDLPVDPRKVAAADGILVIGSKSFGPEFECLIEYSKAAKRFVLFHRLDAKGALAPATRLAIARHLGHYSFYHDDLKSGAVSDTTRLDAGEQERAQADQAAVDILVPSNALGRDLGALSKRYDVPFDMVARQARYCSRVRGEPEP